ncbi:MAG: nucleotidyl transferase AbiEii/AbiGii toxin family protein [Parcubacteria group bacterium]|nr:nucleotidyl transferase AbiEii/AbiGii toxin family protein [Parcubacteria group bacterium]
MKIETIKSEQREIFPELKRFSEFYLVGGTALALQLGHRVSIDFDLFTEKDLPKDLWLKVKRVFKNFKINRIVNTKEQLSIIVGTVKIDFVSHKFPFILAPIRFKGVKIAKPAEIALMKAFTLNFRGTNKDYIDLYFLIKGKHITLEKIVKLGEKKYGQEFNFNLFLQQLLYYQDLKKENITFLKKKVTEKEVYEFFKKEVTKMQL